MCSSLSSLAVLTRLSGSCCSSQSCCEAEGLVQLLEPLCCWRTSAAPGNQRREPALVPKPLQLLAAHVQPPKPSSSSSARCLLGAAGLDAPAATLLLLPREEATGGLLDDDVDDRHCQHTVHFSAFLLPVGLRVKALPPSSSTVPSGLTGRLAALGCSGQKWEEPGL